MKDDDNETQEVIETQASWLKLYISEGYSKQRRKNWLGPLVLAAADDTGKRSAWLRIEEIPLVIDGYKRLLAHWEATRGPVGKWVDIVREVAEDELLDLPTIPLKEWEKAAYGTPDEVRNFIEHYQQSFTADMHLTAAKMLRNAIKRHGEEVPAGTLVEPNWWELEKMSVRELVVFLKLNGSKLSSRDKKEVVDLIKVKKAAKDSETEE